MTRSMRLVSIVMPPWIGTAPPQTPEPPPYGTIGTCIRRATRMISAISPAVAGHTTTSGGCSTGAPARTARRSRGHMSRL